MKKGAGTAQVPAPALPDADVDSHRGMKKRLDETLPVDLGKSRPSSPGLLLRLSGNHGRKSLEIRPFASSH